MINKNNIIAFLLALLMQHTLFGQSSNRIDQYTQTQAIDGTTYLLGYKSVGGANATRGFKLPFTVQGGQYKVQSLVNGVVVAGTDTVQRAVPFDTLFAKMDRGGWDSLIVLTTAPNGGLTGTIYYRVDPMARLMILRGTVTSNYAQNLQNATNITAIGPKLLGNTGVTLPLPYYFTSYFWSNGFFLNYAGIDFIRELSGYVDVNGDVKVWFIKPDATIPAYSIYVNAIIPLY